VNTFKFGIREMNEYQQEQLDALKMVRHGLRRLGDARRADLIEKVRDYMQFRQSVDDFLNRYFNKVCTRTCYRSRISACCARDSIITFFADTVVNALQATPAQLDRMETMLLRVNEGHRCVYLGPNGCTWTIRPVVCAMFLCDHAMNTVFSDAPESAKNVGFHASAGEKIQMAGPAGVVRSSGKCVHRSGLPFHAHAPEPEPRIAAGQGKCRTD
jgi:hypothetical protein